MKYLWHRISKGDLKISSHSYINIQLFELKEKFSEEFMQLAARQYEKVSDVNNRGKWKPTPESIDSHQAPEWLEDAKFGMFIDWGPWAIAGWAPKKKEGPRYPDRYESRIFTDSGFRKYHEKNWGRDFNIDDFIPMYMCPVNCLAYLLIHIPAFQAIFTHSFGIYFMGLNNLLESSYKTESTEPPLCQASGGSPLRDQLRGFVIFKKELHICYL